jgi:hypothetical protein
MFTSHWRQRGLPKRRYPTTTLHGVTTQKTATWTSSGIRFVARIRVFRAIWLQTSDNCAFVELFMVRTQDEGVWSASRFGRFISGEKSCRTHSLGGWVSPRAGLDAVAKKECSYIYLLTVVLPAGFVVKYFNFIIVLWAGTCLLRMSYYPKKLLSRDSSPEWNPNSMRRVSDW